MWLYKKEEKQMSCSACGTLSCGCSQMYTQAMQAAQNISLSQMAQQGYYQQQLGMALPSLPDPEYEMFKKYAALDDGELTKLYMEECLADKVQHDQELEAIKKAHDLNCSERDNRFFNWCAKYRKSITKERLDKLRAFL